MTLRTAAILFAALLAIQAWVFGAGVRRWPGLGKTLPRQRVPGILIGAVCLVWAGNEVQIMLEGDLARLQTVIWWLVPAVLLLAWRFLDFLLVRALGGLVLLLIPVLLLEAFARHLPLRPAFSALCYVLALAAMVMVAAPWHYRNLLERAATTPRLRTGLATGLGLSATVMAAVATFAG